MRFACAIAMLIALAVTGCEGGPSDEPTGASGEPGAISKADFGADWPFTVSSGTLRCHGSGGTGAVTFEANGTEYGVNGLAKTQDYPDVRPIWADDPDIPGAKKNIGVIIDRGLELCS